MDDGWWASFDILSEYSQCCIFSVSQIVLRVQMVTGWPLSCKFHYQLGGTSQDSIFICYKMSSSQSYGTCQKILWWTLPNKWYLFGYHKIQFVKKGLNDWLQFSDKDISSVQSLSPVQLFATPWTAAHQASLSITNSWSLLKLMSMELVMPSKHLIFCGSLLLPPSIFPSIRVFSNESALRMRWPKYWSFSFSISPSNEYSGLISFRMD